MEFKFDAKQQYQLEAIGSLVQLFDGQPKDAEAVLTTLRGDGQLPHVTMEELQRHSEAVICLSGGPDGPVDPLFAQGKTAEGVGTLAEMSPTEWESLCDGCGLCCVIRFEDEDTGEVIPTRVHCKLFDGDTCQCSDYVNRKRYVPDCIKLTPGNVADLEWMPKSCAYRRLHEGRPLADWHPLISGDPESVHAAGVSVRGETLNEVVLAHPDDALDFIAEDLIPVEMMAVTVTNSGYIKRTALDQYRTQGRGGKGVLTIQHDRRRGELIGALIVDDDSELYAITSGGGVIRTTAKSVRKAGRQTKGVRLMNIDEGTTVIAIARNADEPDETEVSS